jgi:hypothetical protein
MKNSQGKFFEEYVNREYKSLPDVIVVIPEIIVQIEANRNLTGSEKKEFVIRLVSLIIRRITGISEEEINNFLITLPIVIDGLVFVGNTFKRKFRCCSISKRKQGL